MVQGYEIYEIIPSRRKLDIRKKDNRFSIYSVWAGALQYSSKPAGDDDVSSSALSWEPRAPEMHPTKLHHSFLLTASPPSFFIQSQSYWSKSIALTCADTDLHCSSGHYYYYYYYILCMRLRPAEDYRPKRNQPRQQPYRPALTTKYKRCSFLSQP